MYFVEQETVSYLLLIGQSRAGIDLGDVCQEIQDTTRVSPFIVIPE